jgi:VWFA-related protein
MLPKPIRWATAVAGISGVALVVSSPYATPLRAQQSGQIPVFTSRVELVRVDVQVVQKTGNPVVGLGLDDFQAWLDGRPRRVVSAELVSFAYDQPAPNDAPVRTPGLVPEDSRVFIIAVDQMGLSAAAMMPVREALRKFLTRLRSQDMVGLYEFPYRAPRLDITHDRAIVSRALDHVLGMRELNMGTFSLMPSEISDITANDTDVTNKVISRECPPIAADPLCPDMVRMEAHGLASHLEGEAAMRMGDLVRLAQSLSTIQGRKTILLVSGGLIASTRPGGRPDVRSMMQNVGDDIANAQANLYVLHLDSSFADAYSALARPSLRPADRFESLMDDRVTMTSGLEQLAGRAGGALFSIEAGTPEYALNRVLLETGSYYVLGVEPSEEDRDGKSHFIRVNTTAKDVTVRSRVQVLIPKK